MAGGGRGHRGRDRGRIRRPRLDRGARGCQPSAAARSDGPAAGPRRARAERATRLRGGPRRRPSGGRAVHRPATPTCCSTRRVRCYDHVRALDDGWRWDYASRAHRHRARRRPGTGRPPARHRRPRAVVRAGVAAPGRRRVQGRALRRGRGRVDPRGATAGTRRRFRGVAAARAGGVDRLVCGLRPRARGARAQRRGRRARHPRTAGARLAVLRAGAAPAGGELPGARPRGRGGAGRLPRRPAARVRAVRGSGRGRPHPPVAQQHAAAAGGVGGVVDGERGVERAPDAARRGVRAGQPRCGAEAGARAPDGRTATRRRSAGS